MFRVPTILGTWPRHTFALCRALVLSIAPIAALAQVSVSDGGQATYTQAIAVPPGIAGMQPNLSLSYVQGGLNGPLGVGWSLQGISSMTRCGSSKAIDGNAAPVVFGPADKICLDGQRLIQTDEAGNPLATQTDDARGPSSAYREFRTEKDTYARIRAYGAANGSDANGPATFKVWTKSGLIYEYGSAPALAADARVLAQGKTAVAVWAVSRISDVAGNYIDFKYQQRDVIWGSGPSTGITPGHEWNLVEIQYTGNASQPPVNKIIFEYEDRSSAAGAAQDRAEAYQNGSKNVSVQRLKAIRSYVNWPGPALGVDPAQNGAPLTPPSTALRVRTLKLSYDNGPITHRSRLVKITECAGSDESKCFPPVQFTYSAGGNASFTPSTTFNLKTETLFDASGSYGSLVGDFDGNGLTDILRWGSNPTDNRLWLNSVTGTFTQAAAFNIRDQNLFKSDQCYSTVAADFNADGLTDLLRIMRSTSSGGAACGTLRHMLYLSNGDGSFRAVEVAGIDFSQKTSVLDRILNCPQPANGCTEPGDGSLGTVRSAGANFHLLDVNGDGFLDIVTTVLPGFPQTQTPPSEAAQCAVVVCTHVFLGSAAGTFAELVGSNLTHRSVYADPLSGGWNWYRKPYAGDVNGDGRLDLLVDSGVWLSRGDGSFDMDASAPPGLGCLHWLDANADGRSDCLGPSISAAVQFLQIGDGTFTPKKSASFNLTGAGQELWGLNGLIQSAGLAILDGFDGMRPALLRWKDDPTQNKLYLSNGDGSFREDISFNLNTAAHQLQHSNGQTAFELGEFTGKGSLSLLRLKHAATSASEGAANQLYVRTDPTPPDLLQSVKTGSGAVTDIVYQPLTLSSRHRSDRGTTNAATYPLADVVAPIYLVTSTLTDSGIGGGRVTTDYAYAGLKSHLGGRGLLGFREVRHQSPGPNGENFTVVTQYVQQHPYIGVSRQTETRRGALFDEGQRLSLTTNTYCDKTAATGAETTAAPSAPCATTAKVQRPYLLQSEESGTDLNGIALPSVRMTHRYNTSGDPTEIIVTTTGSLGGLSQTFARTTAHTYLADNTSGERWILGRLQNTSVRQSVPDSLAALTTPASLTLRLVPGNTLTLRAASPGLASGTVTLSGSGGVAPYTFGWTRLSGSRVNVSGSQLATFSTTVANNDQFTETFRATLTDAVGSSTNADFSVTVIGPVALPQTTLVASPNALSFGSINKDSTKSLALTLTNTGPVSATTLGYSLAYSSGTLSQGRFELLGGTCPVAGGTLAAGASCTASIQYVTACTSGSRAGSLTISSPNFASLVVSLTGSTNSTSTCN